MEFSRASEIFYDCIDLVSLAYCNNQSKGFYLFSADINKFRSEVGEEYWEHLVDLEQSGMGTAVDLVLCSESKSISMVFIASGKRPPSKLMDKNYSTPLIRFITTIEQLKSNSNTATT